MVLDVCVVDEFSCMRFNDLDFLIDCVGSRNCINRFVCDKIECWVDVKFVCDRCLFKV